MSKTPEEIAREILDAPCTYDHSYEEVHASITAMVEAAIKEAQAEARRECATTVRRFCQCHRTIWGDYGRCAPECQVRGIAEALESGDSARAKEGGHEAV